MRIAPWRRVAAALLVLVLAACGSSPPREEILGFLDATYQADPQRPGVWLSGAPVPETADTISERMEPEDTFDEQQSTFLRSDDYIVAVFPEGAGSRVELDDYERMRNRYLPLILPFWGPRPGLYGPRGGSGGDFRGGGTGFGK